MGKSGHKDGHALCILKKLDNGNWDLNDKRIRKLFTSEEVKDKKVEISLKSYLRFYGHFSFFILFFTEYQVFLLISSFSSIEKLVIS